MLIPQVDLVVHVRGITRIAGVHRRAEIFPEAWQQHFRRLDPAADHGPPLQHDHAVAGLGQVGCAKQAVVSGAADHVIELVARPADDPLASAGRRCQGQRRQRGRAGDEVTPGGGIFLPVQRYLRSIQESCLKVERVA